MKQITVEPNPSEEQLKKLGIKHWPTWQKEVSVFPWKFITTEYAYILEGECVMTPEDGSPAVTFKAGDLVISRMASKAPGKSKSPSRSTSNMPMAMLLNAC